MLIRYDNYFSKFYLVRGRYRADFYVLETNIGERCYRYKLFFEYSDNCKIFDVFL